MTASELPPAPKFPGFRPLFESTLVRVSHARCDFPGTPAVNEMVASTHHVILPRQGRFAVQAGRGPRTPAIIDATRGFVIGATDGFRLEHPVPSADAAVFLSFVGNDLPVRARPVLISPDVLYRHYRLLSAARRTESRDSLAVEEEAVRLAGALVHAAASAAPSRAQPAAQKRIVDATRDLLLSAPSTQHSLKEIGRAVCASPYHLSRMFTAQMGMPIHRYLLRIRLAMALDRIANGETHLSQMALELGFSSHTHFSAAFRQTFGVTPRDARNELCCGVRQQPKQLLRLDA